MRLTVWGAGIILVAAGLTGCGSVSDREPPLIGTTWELVSLQSNNGAQGATSVPDPGKFWLIFDKDDKAFFTFDCNRGKGTYSAKASGDGSKGDLTFSPINTTTDTCAPPSLGERVTTAMAGVRSYTYKDKQLYLTLTDGGTLQYRPA